MLRLALELVDRIVAALPSRAAYALADLLGAAWYRVAADRRRLVAANLARVCAATGRQTRGRPFRDLVRAAFRNHARYYVELLRTPHYAIAEIGDRVEVRQWPAFEPVLRDGPGMLVSSHLGNFEPFGVFMAAHGFRPLAPIEEIEPPELFAFLAARRGGASVELIPLSRARKALSAELRAGGTVGIIGDRDLNGGGLPVTMFGHPTTMPLGPALLAITHGAAVIVGRCLRTGPDHFVADGEILDLPATGNRRSDMEELTARLAARFERDIGEAPEQWWGAFQPFWPDLQPGSGS
ncbi:MAG: lysophospholipid acyltransferase family protein [Candidatus Limnocylindria bacterium]